MNHKSLLLGMIALLAVGCQESGTLEEGEPVSAVSQALSLKEAREDAVDATQDKEDAEPQSVVSKSSAKSEGVVSTRLTVRVNKNGFAEVVDAIEVPGYLKLEKHLGRGHIYEVRSGDKVLAVQGVDLDFEQRSIGDSRDVTTDANTAEVFVDVPGVALSEIENAEVTLHKVTASHPEKRASIAALGRLNRARGLSVAAGATSAQLRKAIRTHGRRVRPN